MNQRKHFCSNCGQPVDESAFFCGQCGVQITPANPQQNTAPPGYQSPPNQPPVYQSPPVPQPPPYYVPPAYAPPPAPVPTSGYPEPGPGIQREGLIGVIPNASRKKGLLSTEVFNIVVTDQRLVFALMTSQIIKDAAASKRGGGIGGFIKAMGSGYTLWERYLTMPPEQVLQENSNNFAVYFNQIRKVKFSGDKVLFKKGVFTIGLKMGSTGDDNENAKLEIDTITGKHNFEITSQFQQQTAQVLKNAGLTK